MLRLSLKNQDRGSAQKVFIMKRILVAGATGYLGKFIVKELKSKGYWVRVLIRKAEQAELFTDVDDFFIGNVTCADSLSGIRENIDWVFSSIGITRQKDGMTYMDVDYQGNINLLNEAIQSKVKSFQYVSAINGYQMRQLKIFEAKEMFVDELKVAKIKHSIIRPNGFFSDMSDFLDMAKGGRVYLFGHGNFKMNPIHGQDLAQFCIDQLEKGTPEISVGGSETFSHNELAELALKAWNKPIKITHLPDWTRKLTIWLMRTFTSSKTYGPIEFFMTAMASDQVAEGYGRQRLEDFFAKEVTK